MNENDQNIEDVLQQDTVEDQAGGPVTGPDTDNAASDAVTDAAIDTDEIYSGTVEDPIPQQQDISFNVALLFVASMIVGLMVFGSLSRKWHA